MSFWACNKCTFINEAKQDICKVCLLGKRNKDASASASTTPIKLPPSSSLSSSPSPSLSTHSSTLTWGCRACTYINKPVRRACGLCGTPKPEVSAMGATLLDLDGPSDEEEEEEEEEEREDDEEKDKALKKTKFRPLRSTRPSHSIASKDHNKTIDVNMGEEGGEAHQIAPIAALSSRNKPTSPPSAKMKSKMESQKDGSDASIDVVMDSYSGSQSSGISNSVLGQLHLQRIARAKKESVNKNQVIDNKGSQKQIITILTYNIWFNEEVELIGRMNAIGNTIQTHRPNVVCFQEVTPNIYKIFQRSTWWKDYHCSLHPDQVSKRAYFCMLDCSSGACERNWSAHALVHTKRRNRLSTSQIERLIYCRENMRIMHKFENLTGPMQLSRVPFASYQRKPFPNSVMGRELCVGQFDLVNDSHLTVATTHLESPCPAPPTWNQMFSPERVWQAKEALNTLNSFPNVVFVGDMNWDDKLDGPPPLPQEWFDAWLKLHPGQDGFTYDCKANPMLTGSRLRKRLDRMFCSLRDFEVDSIEIVGTEAILGLTYQKQKKVKNQVQSMTLPVLPSDHFGLLLTISSM